ncbi:hypothetical protein FKR81_22205 [Lentzea tibetensis]|uniref:Uncharacterized protein n=1 Tax=Lentzea tibetensis TaxID=2591470 RepID=A0A563EQL0_9PSEU|nr:hypothetical protein [Lentzea tibetensis]TWP49951.1 hypothetical protein FKR81_22205 [Lentzea tibetensis]
MTQHVEGHGNTVAGRDAFTLYGDQLAKQVLIRDEITTAQVRAVRERFAPPVGFQAALDTLRRESVVMLECSGDGLRTAGICLLRELDLGRERPIEHIPVDEDTELGLRRVEPEALVLVDFRAAERLGHVERRFEGFRAAVTGEGGRIVLLLSGNESSDFRHEYWHLVKRLDAPIVHDVLEAHLRGEMQEHLPEILCRWVETAPDARPADAVRFAQLLRDFRAQSPELPLSTWLAEAMSVFEHYVEDLAERFDKAPPRRRGLTLAIALLNGARNEVVHDAERSLLKVVDYAPESLNPLAGEGFSGRVVELKSATLSGGRVSFTKRDYDTSVLHHVWQGFFELRDPLEKWITAIPGTVQLDASEQGKLAGRVLALCAENGNAALLLNAVAKWVHHDESLAVALLSGAAADDRIAVQVRRKLYSWAKDPQLSPLLGRAVITVCAGDFGRAYPEMALTRLGHVASHGNPDVVARAVDAMLGLATGRPAVLNRVVTWLRDGTREQWLMAAGLLQRLTERGGPELTGELLGNAWYELLNGRDRVEVDRVVRERLTLALVNGAGLDSLVRAARGDRALLDLIDMASFRWLREDPDERGSVHERLLALIDQQHPAGVA